MIITKFFLSLQQIFPRSFPNSHHLVGKKTDFFIYICEIKKNSAVKKEEKKSFGVEVKIIAQLMLRNMELTIILTMEL